MDIELTIILTPDQVLATSRQGFADPATFAQDCIDVTLQHTVETIRKERDTSLREAFQKATPEVQATVAEALGISQDTADALKKDSEPVKPGKIKP